MRAARQWRQSRHALIESCHAISLPLSSPTPLRIHDLGDTGRHEDDLNRTDAVDVDSSEVQFQYLRHIRADKIEQPTAVTGCRTMLFQQTVW